MGEKRRFQTKRVVLAAGMTVFAAALAGGALYAPAKEDVLSVRKVPDASFTKEDYDKLRELQFDGYEALTVRAYQKIVWQKLDEPAYGELLERMSGSAALYEKRDEDELAHFLFYVLEPLTAERWQAARSFGGYTQEVFGESGQTAMVEYNYMLSIIDADTLTVGAYSQVQDGMRKGMEGLLKGKSKEELADADGMRVFLDESVEQLKEQWSMTSLKIDVEYCFQPVELQENENRTGSVPGEEDAEPRRFPNGSPEDYRSLLALKTPDYEALPVYDFNRSLLEWANENYERMECIAEDTGRNDFQVELSGQERDFVTRTVLFSGRENAKYVQSNYTGCPEEDPYYQEVLPEKGGDQAWCDLYYTFTYHIADKKLLTVGERDRLVGGMIDDVRACWRDMDPDVLLSTEKADLVDMLQYLAAKNSGEGLTIHVDEDDVWYETLDERGGYDLLVSYRTKDYGKMSVADFRAALCDSEGELDRLLDANAQVAGTVSQEDENYDFLMYTMSTSLSELYCEKFGEMYGVPAVITKQERPCGGWGGEEMQYAFQFYASLWISYTIEEPKLLTVEERDRTLQAMRDGLQDWLDELDEEKIAHGDAKALLERKGAALAKKLSGDNMKVMFEVQGIDMYRD